MTKAQFDTKTHQYADEITQYIENYFETIKMVIEKEEAFFTKLALPIITTVDYIKLMRFLRTCFNMIKEIDTDLLGKTPFLTKLFKDCDALYDIYTSKAIAAILFETQFLVNSKPYKALEHKLNKSTDLRNSNEHTMKMYERELEELVSKNDPSATPLLRALKGKLADSIHTYATHRDEANLLAADLQEMHKRYKELFIPQFENKQKEYSAKLTLLLNKRLFLLEKVLSYEASNSKHVEAFFIQAGITGEFGIKLFIQNYIKNIHAENAQDNEWHTYLKNILHSMD